MNDNDLKKDDTGWDSMPFSEPLSPTYQEPKKLSEKTLFGGYTMPSPSLMLTSHSESTTNQESPQRLRLLDCPRQVEPYKLVERQTNRLKRLYPRHTMMPLDEQPLERERGLIFNGIFEERVRLQPEMVTTLQEVRDAYRRQTEEVPHLNQLFPVQEKHVSAQRRVQYGMYLFGTPAYSSEYESIIVRMDQCAKAAKGRDWTSEEESYIKLVKQVCGQLPLFKDHAGARMALIDSIESMLDALYLRIKG